jgi:hypothetical protein
LLVIGFFVVFDIVAEMVAVEVAVGEGGDSDHAEEVGYHVAFNFEVEGGVGVHRGGHVDFHQPGFEVAVDEHVEAQHFVAAVVERSLAHEGSVENLFPRKNGLDDKIINAVEEIGGFFLPDAVVQEIFDSGETPLTAEVLFILFLTLDELHILLVYAVIGQMLKFLILAVAVCFIIDLCSESAQTFLVDIDAQGVDSGDGYVDAEVEFETIDEKRVVDVVAYDQG